MDVALVNLLPLLVLAAAPATWAAPGEMAAFRALETEVFDRAPAADGSGLLPDLLTTRTLAARSAAPPPAAPRLGGIDFPVTLNGPVRDFLGFFDGRGRSTFATWYARMGRYEELMAPVLARHGVPRALLYVCMIESGFNVDAVSRASAVGPWQFVRSTAKLYGLRIDDWVDERRDPERATEAAARHFKDLHDRFGSWPLALAAYNAGVGGVLRAMQRANVNDYWGMIAAGELPREASRYVPKIVAAMVIGADPAQWGFEGLARQTPMRFETVPMPAETDLRSVARASSASMSELAALNPALLRGYTPPGGDWPLRVPPEAAASVRRFAERPTAVGARFWEHRFRFGELLRDVASRYQVGRSMLRRVNGLRHREPRPGEVLLVPTLGRSAPPAAPENDTLLVLRDTGLAFRAGDRREVFFPVRSAVAVTEVAAFFGVRAADIALWNGLDPAAPLQRGMVVRLFVPSDFDDGLAVLVPRSAVTEVKAGSKGEAAARRAADAEPSPHLKRVSHKVRRGESLWSIAQRHGTTVSALRAHNGLGPGTGLSIGQTLHVPVVSTPVPRGAAARRKPKPGARGRTTYRVRSGDSLWKIARKFGTTVKALKRANGFGRRVTLQPGQRVRIP